MDTIDNNESLDASSEYEGTLSPLEDTNFAVNKTYIDMRFTFSNQDKELECLRDSTFMSDCRNKWAKTIAYICKSGYMQYGKYTSGLETLNRLGESCKCHFHLRFTTTHQVQNVRRRVKEFITGQLKQDTTGNHCMMFKSVIVQDEFLYFAYPIKQNYLKRYCGGFKDTELELMHKTANANYQKTIECNQAKANSRDKTDTLFERLVIYLDKLNYVNRKTHLINATKFYVEEDRPVNKQIISGYVDTYMLKRSQISYEDFWSI
jgi:hypothetical protein